MRSTRHRLLLFILVLGFLAHSDRGLAEDAPPPTPEVWSESVVEGQINALDDSLRSGEGTPQERAARLRLKEAWRRLQDMEASIALVTQELETVRSRLEELRRSGNQEKAPYTLSYYDQVHDELAQSEHDAEAATLGIKLADDAEALAKQKAQEAGQAWRAANDTARTLRNAEPPSAEAMELLRLAKETTRVQLRLARLDLDKAKLKETLALTRIEAATLKLEWVRTHLEFSESDLNAQLKLIDAKREETHRLLKELRAQRSRDESRFAAQESDPGLTGPARDTRLEAHEAWRRAYVEGIGQAEQRLSLLSRAESLWRLRYTLLNETSRSEQPQQNRHDLEDFSRLLERSLAVENGYQTGVSQRLAAISDQLTRADLEPEQAAALRDLEKALNAQFEQRQTHIAHLLSASELVRRVQQELEAQDARTRATQAFEQVTGHFRAFWDIELWVIDNNPVTVRKVTVATILLLIGLFLARYFVRFMGKRVLAATPLRPSTVVTIQRILHYAANLMVLLMALRTVNIPLDAFAFLGGAIAIGVGFGAQNLLNNLISGFLIMAERPIRIDDVIEVDGKTGQVEEIGTRCTRIRTGDNLRILIPNSTLVQATLVNWTLTDTQVRASVKVGVAYGSDLRRVETLLIRAATEQPEVMTEPPPFVLFTDFGDNALQMEVHFWIQVTAIIQRRLLESHLRFRIDDLFREAGICIAFPQRDLHVDSLRPIEVKVLGNG